MAAEPDFAARHEATQHLMRTLRPNPALDGTALDIAVATWHHALDMIAILRDGPELTAGLRFLRQHKDCLVIQALLDSGVIARS
jgi:hypothetical protein